MIYLVGLLMIMGMGFCLGAIFGITIATDMAIDTYNEIHGEK